MGDVQPPGEITPADVAIATLGEARHRSPLYGAHLRRSTPAGGLAPYAPAGPRSRLFFEPTRVRAGIVSCGGLCPGINDVIRGLVLQLLEQYGVREVLGFRNGYRGLVSPDRDEPVSLTAESIRGIDRRGGSILGTSRGAQDPAEMVDTLALHGLDMLFVIGGDGSLRGAAAIAAEAAARQAPIAVVGIPKTIDNDIPIIDQSFGFQTAFMEAAHSIRAAHAEAESHANGVGLVKLMGRHSGFIAAYASLASHEADVVLIPEVPFALEGPGGVLEYVHRRIDANRHCVIVVAEGAGQELISAGGTDASGNARLGDIGTLMRQRLIGSFAVYGRELNLRYVDPGYAIRSVPANGSDGVYCTRLAHAAAHAAMAGATAMCVGGRYGAIVEVPLSLITAGRNVVDPQGDLWLAVLEATGQPPEFRSAINLRF